MKLIVACRGAESDATVSFPHFISPVFQKLPDFDQNILKELIYKKKNSAKILRSVKINILLTSALIRHLIRVH